MPIHELPGVVFQFFVFHHSGPSLQKNFNKKIPILQKEFNGRISLLRIVVHILLYS